MKRIQIQKKLYDEIKEYCSYNDIKEVNQYIIHLIELGFNFTKYGVSPFNNQIPQFVRQEEKQPIIKEKEVVTVKEELPKVEIQEKKEKKKGITIIKN